MHVLQFLMYESHNIMSLLRNMKLVSRDTVFLSRDKSVGLAWSFNMSRDNVWMFATYYLSLGQVPMMWRHKPDLLLSLEP